MNGPIPGIMYLSTYEMAHSGIGMQLMSYLLRMLCAAGIWVVAMHG